MSAFKIISFPVALLLLMNGCGLSLEVQKRVHRPGFYVNLSHEKEYVKVNGQQESKRRKTQEGAPASLQKVKRNSYEEFEIETDQSSVEKAPLMDVMDSNFSIARIGGAQTSLGVSEQEQQAFSMFESSLKHLQNRAESAANTLVRRGAPGISLIDIFLTLFALYLVFYLLFLIFIGLLTLLYSGALFYSGGLPILIIGALLIIVILVLLLF